MGKNFRKRASTQSGLPAKLFTAPLSHHGHEVERLEDNRESGILTASSCLLSPTEISVFQLSANYSFTNTRTASVTFKALQDLAPTYFSCGDPVLAMVTHPPLQHTPPTLLRHSHTTAHLLATNGSSHLH